MNVPAQKASYRPGLHVHTYLWLALIVVSILPFLILSGMLFDSDHVAEGLAAFIFMVVAFQVLLWLARQRCATPNLGVWDGWLRVTGSMTIGIGWISLLVAVPSAAFAVSMTGGIALLNLFEASPANAQRRFHRMVSWFLRHRMYQ